MIRILLADDHQLLHPGIRTILSETDGFLLVDAVACDHKMRHFFHKYQPDVLLLALNIIDSPCKDIFHDIKKQCPTAKILILLNTPDEICMRQLIDFDKAGVILKSEAPEKLIEAILAIIAGQKWLSPVLMTQLIYPQENRQSRRLTDREIEVLRLVASEKSDKEIAIVLGIKERTVRFHLDNSKMKLGKATRIGVVVEAIRNKMF